MAPFSKCHPVLDIANEHGIKNIWTSMFPLDYYTRFLLPSFDRQETSEIRSNEIVEFWMQLADIHKERRLLVDFMCCRRMMIEEYQGEFNLGFGTKAVERVKEILRECISDSIWIMRRLFIEEQHHRRRLPYVFKQFSIGLADEKFTTVQKRFMDEFFAEPLETAFARGKSVEHATESTFSGLTTYMIAGSFQGITRLIEGWMAATRTTDLETAEERKRYLSKLKVAAPHWRLVDRAYILKAVETNGESCDGSYVQKLIEAVGLEKFKLIAFGREKFCASCGQSSYTAEDQLLACKRCVRERIRPKARYCNTDCQRAHWLQHKAEIHACANCGRLSEGDQGRLRACMRCIEEKMPTPARYCDVVCQKTDWKKHKANVHAKPKEPKA